MNKMIKLLVLAGFVCCSQSAFAAGFMIGEQSVSSLGTAYASRTVGTDDAGIVFANPAGMTSLKACTDAVFGGFLIMPHSKFHNSGTTNVNPPYFAPGQAYLNSTQGGEAGCNRFVPNLAVAKKIGCKFAVGLTINSPFGLVTDYNERWYGRYYATLSEIITININPAIAYKINDCISIGAGFSAQYFHAQLKNMLNIAALASAPLPDAEVKLKGNCWGYGGNVGILCSFNCDKTRLGVHYRSQVRQNLKNGRVKFKDVPEGALQAVFVNAKASTVNVLPDIVSIGLSHQVMPCLTLYADFLWSHWGLIKNLFVKFDNTPPAIESDNTVLKWKNVWEYCVGLKYQVNCQAALRAGYLYDYNPTPNKQLRTPRLPDQDRQVVAVGLQYNWTNCISFDVSYGHTFFKRASIDYTGKAETDPQAYALKGGLKGKQKTQAELFGAQAHITF